MVDMHVHSNWSDGGDSPAELIRKAGEIGLEGFALTDHDTLAGIPSLKAAAAGRGVRVWGGIEISCTQPGSGKPLHLLGYGIPARRYGEVEAFCAPIRRSRDRAVRASAARLERAGYPVSPEKIQAYAGPAGGLYKQFIMQLLVEAGLCDGLYAPLYRRLFKKDRSGRPGVAALSFETADPVGALRCIRAAGGVAVLAHPGQYDNFDFLPTLIGNGLGGIEAYHPKHTPQHVARCLRIAKAHRLFVTGGSDYHGKFGEGETLGQCAVPVPDVLEPSEGKES